MELVLHLTGSTAAEELSEHDMQLFDNGMGPSQLRAEIDAGSCLLLRVDHELAGYALTRQQGPLIDVTRLAVLPDFRGKGFGRKLLQTTIQLHRDSRYMLNVRKTNNAAIQLYKSEGFRIRGTVLQSWLMIREPSR
jgi:ribosomal-protein-alanine N-acetyltransferase